MCGMNLNGIGDVKEIYHNGKSFYFCGEWCKNRFLQEPEKFQKIPLIKLNNVWKTFKIGGTETHALRGLNLNVWPGDFTALIGASGSGKSTVLNMIGLLDRPTSGKIFFNGEDISSFGDEKRTELRSKTFGFVFQQYNLIPWLTAYENVTLPLIFANKNVEEERIRENFREMGLEKRMGHRPFELSGGEQQRVAMLRALSNNPEIILGDEPTGNLDSATGNKILEILFNFNKIHKKTLIIVTHDADIAEKADQIITAKDGQTIRNHMIHKKIYTE